MSRGPQIRFSPQHGVNPSPKCFYCLQDKNQTMLLGLMRGGVEAPRNMVWDHEACDTCAGHMLQGVILISVRNDCEPGDENPYRTGGWVVITDDAIRRIVGPLELRDEILRLRMAFVPDEAWDRLGLPQEEVKPGGGTCSVSRARRATWASALSSFSSRSTTDRVAYTLSESKDEAPEHLAAPFGRTPG